VIAVVAVLHQQHIPIVGDRAGRLPPGLGLKYLAYLSGTFMKTSASGCGGFAGYVQTKKHNKLLIKQYLFDVGDVSMTSADMG